MRTIYLDYNATTPLAPRVQEAMLPFLAGEYGDPASDHALGRAAAMAIEDARFRVARAIGAKPGEVQFTSSGAASCDWALGPDRGASECVAAACSYAAVRKRCPAERRVLSDPAGVADRGGLVEMSGKWRPDVVSLPHADAEIGVVQDVAQLGERLGSLRRQGLHLHVDAAQSFGKTRVNVDELKVDLLTLSSHKVYGPKGVGALYRREREPGASEYVEPCLMRGTPNVAAIVGFGYAAELAMESLDASATRLEELRDRLLAQLREAVGQDLLVWGEDAPRLPNTLAAAFPDVAGDELLAACPEICATALGSGSGDRIRLSPALEAIGAEPTLARGTVRLSIGWYTTEEEIDLAASLLLGAWERLRED